MDHDLDFGEIFEKVSLLKQQHSETSSGIDSVAYRVGELSSHLLSGLGSSSQAGELKKQILVLEQLSTHEVQSISSLKSEISRLFGIPFQNVGLSRSSSSQLVGDKGGKCDGKGNVGGKDSTDNKARIIEGNNFEGSFLYRSMVEKLQEREKKINEQDEMLDVYATIVSQYDTEEKKRAELEKSEGVCRNRLRVKDLKLLAEELYTENEMLKDGFKSLQESRDECFRGKEILERRVRQLEVTLLGAAQWHEAVVRNFSAEDSNDLNSCISRPLGKTVCAPNLVKAKVVSPDSWIFEKPDSRRRVEGVDTAFASGALMSVNPLLAQLRGLSPIDVSNPSLQERRLLHRIEIYESKLAELEEWEIDRKRCFDEMEKTRAEFFSSMNEELHKRKEKIHSLSVERDSLRRVSISLRSGTHDVKDSSDREDSTPFFDSEHGEIGRVISYRQEKKSSVLVMLEASEGQERLEIEKKSLLEYCDVVVTFINRRVSEFYVDYPWVTEKKMSGLQKSSGGPTTSYQWNGQKEIFEEKFRCILDGFFELYMEFLKGFEKILRWVEPEVLSVPSDGTGDIEAAVKAIKMLKEKRL